jgi:hypothetical protein
VLEADDNIVSVPHHDDVAMGMASSPLIRPQIEDVMQVDVGQKWRDHRALRCSDLPRCHLSVFRRPGFQPFTDQSDHPPVADTVFDEADQPIVADRIEKARDVGVQYPVHLALADPDRQRVQRIVLATPWPESVAEPQEVFLPDRVQYFDQRTLDNLVLQRGYAQRTLAAIRLRNINPP